MRTETFTHKLRLINDNVNNIQVVPIYLSEVMNVTDKVAELLTQQVHYEGSTILKFGQEVDLKIQCEQLISKGLVAEIEVNIEPLTEQD